jgi:ribosomal protein S18 acetylase RimI-like enzyme
MLFADLDLARRLELADAAKHIAYAEARAKLLGTGCCAWERIGSGYAIFAGADNPYSRVVGLGLDGPVGEAAFEQCEAFYQQHNTQPAFSLCPLADPTLLEHLNRRGYQVEMFMHVWYRPLVPDEAFPVPPSGIFVRAIEPEEADLWTLVAFRGGLDSDEALSNASVIIAPYPYMAHTRCWLAWRNREPGAHEPVGAATLGIHDGVASLFGASTRVPYRRLGIQAALLDARLAAAVGAHCEVAVVHTEPGSGSQRNVERLGFRLAYTRAMLRRE